MASQTNQLHFILFPFMAQGHLIPMIDIGKLLAQRGVIITIVTTPVNAARCKSTLARAKESGLSIQVVEVSFPSADAGLPSGCENLDLEHSGNLHHNFFCAASKMQVQVEDLFNELKPKPSCIISDYCLPYTYNIATKFHIPRISFLGAGCFPSLCLLTVLRNMEAFEKMTCETDLFVMPGLPDEIEITRAQIPKGENMMKEIWEQMAQADLASHGVVVNSFEELESAYVKEYCKARGSKIWCVGPVSLCNKDQLDKAQRGNISSTNEHQCVKWLDSQKPNSVIYACLGSLCNLTSLQLIELGLGLEASQKPFILVVRGIDKLKELDKWIIEQKFEERIKGRGLLIRGWAPQVLILSHPAIVGFITHCGWNSTLEGVTAGVSMITWPLFADQFFNEKFIVQILKIGVRVGAEVAMIWGQEEKMGVLVKKEDVKKAIDMLMDEGEEGKARRERARKLSTMAKGSVEEGGSSYLNVTKLIEDIMQETQMQILH